MKNNGFVKNKSNISILKNFYCIILENAEKRTQGREGNKLENNASPSRYTNHTPAIF